MSDSIARNNVLNSLKVLNEMKSKYAITLHVHIVWWNEMAFVNQISKIQEFFYELQRTNCIFFENKHWTDVVTCGDEFQLLRFKSVIDLEITRMMLTKNQLNKYMESISNNANNIEMSMQDCSTNEKIVIELVKKCLVLYHAKVCEFTAETLSDYWTKEVMKMNDCILFQEKTFDLFTLEDNTDFEKTCKRLTEIRDRLSGAL